MAGPNARSHRRLSSTRASSAVGGGPGDGSHDDIGDQRYWLLVHPPFGRPRTTRCSQDSRKSTRVVIPTVPSHLVPTPTSSCWRRPGTSFDSSAPVASPAASMAATVASSSARRCPSGSATPPSTSMSSVRLRCAGTSASVQAAWTTGTIATGSTNMVRRMHSVRTSRRSS